MSKQNVISGTSSNKLAPPGQRRVPQRFASYTTKGMGFGKDKISVETAFANAASPTRKINKRATTRILGVDAIREEYDDMTPVTKMTGSKLSCKESISKASSRSNTFKLSKLPDMKVPKLDVAGRIK